jgi:hypothetical protein
MIEDPDDSETSPGFLSIFSSNMKRLISCPLRYSSTYADANNQP